MLASGETLAVVYFNLILFLEKQTHTEGGTC